MAFPMNDLLNNYDVFPIVFKAGKETEINIRPQGGRKIFLPGKEYSFFICAIEQGEPDDYPATGSYVEKKAVCTEDGCIKFSHTFPSEQQYFIKMRGENKERLKIPLYAVEGELAERYPYIGDLHIHTTLSDGNQEPEVVSANYRRHGYDFFAITDHCRYYPSLRAIEFYKNVPTEFVIVPGEEVHLPPVHGQDIEPHIVNFGADYSINGLVEAAQHDEVGDDLKFRSCTGKAPEVMSVAEYEDKMEKLAKELTVPENVDLLPAAVTKWIFQEINKAGGLSIFPHPFWISDVYHVPAPLVDFIMQNRDFGAFEVLGGENYFEQNGFQTIRYYEDKAKGINYPIVGSTDSHSSYASNRNAFICSTIVFSPENEKKSLISSIKDFYSVAVDTISEEFRIVGDLRLAKYACFLLKNWFPRHDELCEEEGRLMKQYAVGTQEEKDEALKLLKAINGRVQRLREKYFAF